VTHLTAVQAIHVAIAAGVCAAWIAGLGLLVYHRERYRRLSSLDMPRLSEYPAVSILVPACNEAVTVERGMRSLLELDYPNFEIIAVNDRSDDATGEILERLSASDRRLRTIHLSELPSGWLGKNHALHAASEQANGKWLLFTDADVVFQPDTLKLAAGYAESRETDHLVLAPRFESVSFWERIFLSYFTLMFTFRIRPWAVPRPDRRAYVGLGVFNMVRAEAYRSFGGHRALAMEVADDTKLGKLFKDHGLRTEVLDGSDLIGVRWVIGLRGAVNGLTKNAFAGYDFSLTRAVGGFIALFATGIYPLIAATAQFPAARAIGLINIAVMVGGAAAVRRISGAGWAYGFTYPIGALILMLVVARSTWLALTRGGIEWRGTFYDLEELRRGVV
jgi:cellulose synthase/poly-beta-1,6-N-acetylglucosamine synthase-like glycosyltransferase